MFFGIKNSKNKTFLFPSLVVLFIGQDSKE